MPINRQLVAKASAFQQNCGLNSLVHKLIPNIERNNVPDESIKLFRDQFNAYYESNLNAKEFRDAILSINNPMHREVILAPVLRRMLLLPEVTGPYNFAEMARNNEFFLGLRPEIINPGEALDATEIMPLANFFGIRVETFSPRHFREVVLQRCEKESIERRGIACTAAEKKRIEENIAAINEQNPDFSALASTLLSFVPNLDSSLLGIARGMAVNELRKYYAESATWDYVQHNSPDMFNAQNTILARLNRDVKVAADLPILKFWNRGAHWEYEENSLAAKQAHDQYYDPNRRNYYQYGCIDGAPQRNGAPDVGNIKRKINHALNPAAGGAKNLRLSELMQQYESEQIALREHGAGADAAAGNPARRNANANANKNNQVGSSPFAGFGNLFGGGDSSEIGQKFMSAFMAPFSVDDAQKTADSGKPKSFLEMIMGLVVGLNSMIMKLANGFVGVKPIIDEMQTKANRQKNPASDLQSSELGNHPDARIFDEYVKLLPNDVKARLISRWLDKTASKMAVMDQLQEALGDEGLEQDLEFFNFKRKLQQIAVNNPTLRNHLLQQWQEAVYSKRQAEGELAGLRDKRKAELLAEVENAIKLQADNIKAEMEHQSRESGAMSATSGGARHSSGALPAAFAAVAAAHAGAPAAGGRIDAGLPRPHPITPLFNARLDDAHGSESDDSPAVSPIPHRGNRLRHSGASAANV